MSGLEVIGVIATISQLMIYTNATRSFFSDLSNKIRHAHHEIDEMIKEVKNRAELIQELNYETVPRPDLLKPIVRSCTIYSNELIALLSKLRVLPKSPKHGRGTMWGQFKAGVAWKFKEKSINDFYKRIKQTNNDLNLYLNISELRSLQRIEQTQQALLLLNLSHRFPVLFNQLTGVNSTISLPPAVYQTIMTIKSRVSNLPPRNKHFVGQEQKLRCLEETLQNGGGQAIALVGLGGIGKTELVKEFAYRLWESTTPRSIFYVRASSAQDFEQSYLDIASTAGLSEILGATKVTSEDVKNWLESSKSGSWLMIVDGADQSAAFAGATNPQRLLPNSIDGSIIFTSQSRPLMHKFVDRDSVIPIDGMNFEDGRRLLIRRSGDTDAQNEDIAKLLEALGSTPLAITQAASFISRNPVNIRKYLHLYQESETAKLTLLGEAIEIPGGTLEPPLLTWGISLGRITCENRLAIHLLFFMACLHPQQIQKELLPSTLNHIQVYQALGVLTGYSTISPGPAKESFDMHPLIRLATRQLLRTRGQFDKYVQDAHGAVYGLFPKDFETKEDLAAAQKMLPHAQVLLDEESLPQLADQHAPLALLVSRFLRALGQYQRALIYATMALEQSNSADDQQKPQYLAALNQIAICRQELGQYNTAEKAFEQVLSCRRSIFGPNHEQTLSSMNNWARILHLQGRYPEAADGFICTINLRKRILGEDHPDTLKTWSNLGITLQSQKRYDKAEEVFRYVVEMRKDILGESHTSTLSSISNLGTLLQLRGRWEDAFLAHTEAIKGRCEALGPFHHETLKSQANLAIVLHGQGKVEEAELLARQLLETYTNQLGPEHPDTLSLKNNIAVMLHTQNRIYEAESLSREVYLVQKVKLGPNHPATIHSKNHADGLAAWLKEYGHSLILDSGSESGDSVD